MKLFSYNWSSYPNNLPEKTKDQMLFAFDEIVRVDVNDVAADWLGRVEGLGQVLNLGVDGVGLLVERALVDRVRTRLVDHFAEIESHQESSLFPG